MQFGILVTDYGKHSDEKLAVATADKIIDIGLTGQEVMEARKLKNQITDILEDHHKNVSQNEVSKLGDDINHIVTKIDPLPHTSGTLNQIMEAIDASPFKDKFYNSEIKSQIESVLASWTATNIYMHRDWHSQGKTGHHLDIKDVPGHSHDHPAVKQWKKISTETGHGSGLPPAQVKTLRIS